MAETGNIEDDKDLFKMDELKKEAKILQTKLDDSLVKLYENYEDDSDENEENNESNNEDTENGNNKNEMKGEGDEDLDITFDFELTQQPVIEEMPVIETNEKVLAVVRESKISRFAEMNNQNVNIGFQKEVNYKDIFKIRGDVEELFTYIVFYIIILLFYNVIYRNILMKVVIYCEKKEKNSMN